MWRAVQRTTLLGERHGSLGCVPATATDYREALRVPLWWWLLGAFFVVSVWWAFIVATPAWVAWSAGGVAALGVGRLITRYGAVSVSTSERGLTCSRATLPWSAVGNVTALDPDDTRRLLGVDADARAFLLLRSYCQRSVRVDIVDNVDPTPYWLISTRHPQELADHLRRRAVQD